MNKLILLTICTLVSGAIASQEWKPQEWPVLKNYDQEHLYQIALPLGGIGTGTVSLGGRGELRDWEIMNVPAKKYSTVTTGNNAPFFAIYAKPQNQEATTTLLAGPLYPQEYLHYEGRPVNHHGLPRFAQASFDAAYPFGQVHLSDKDLPVKVTIKGFNPLIPGDAEASGLPVAVLSYEVTNTTSQPMEIAICGSMRNFIGKDGSKFRTDWKGDYIPTGVKDNKNKYVENKGIKGIYLYSDGVDKNDPAWGTVALTTQATSGVSYRTSSKADNWNNGILNFWDDFSADGMLTERNKQEDEDPMASLSVKKTVKPQSTETFTFYITWNFPNRKAWSSTVVGNYYSRQYTDAWKAAETIIPQNSRTGEENLIFRKRLTQYFLSGCCKRSSIIQSGNLTVANRIPFTQRSYDGLGRRNGSFRFLRRFLYACLEL